MQPNSKAKKTSLALAVALGLLGAACGDVDESPAAFDCAAESLPGQYIRQSGGSYDSDEISARSERLDLHQLGLRNATFNFWKEDVDAVPFDPPANIVCEVLTFASDDGARAFLAALEPSGESLAATSITWPRDAAFRVEEAALDEEPGIRAFTAHEETGSPRTLISLFEVEGSRVRVVHAGGEEIQLTPGQLVPALRSISTVP